MNKEQLEQLIDLREKTPFTKNPSELLSPEDYKEFSKIFSYRLPLKAIEDGKKYGDIELQRAGALDIAKSGFMYNNELEASFKFALEHDPEIYQILFNKIKKKGELRRAYELGRKLKDKKLLKTVKIRYAINDPASAYSIAASNKDTELKGLARKTLLRKNRPPTMRFHRIDGLDRIDSLAYHFHDKVLAKEVCERYLDLVKSNSRDCFTFEYLRGGYRNAFLSEDKRLIDLARKTLVDVDNSQAIRTCSTHRNNDWTLSKMALEKCLTEQFRDSTDTRIDEYTTPVNAYDLAKERYPEILPQIIDKFAREAPNLALYYGKAIKDKTLTKKAIDTLSETTVLDGSIGDFFA